MESIFDKMIVFFLLGFSARISERNLKRRVTSDAIHMVMASAIITRTKVHVSTLR